jgi:hypothetical protein
MISKIIHQTWFDNNKQLPLIFDKMIQESKKKNIDFEFKLWTNSNIEDFLNNNYKKIYEIYSKNILGVQKSDLARLAILHYYGGIYINSDILLLKNLNDLFDFNKDMFYISYEPTEQTKYVWNNENYICNAFFACNKNNIIIENIIETIILIYNQYGDKIFNQFNIFGSNLYMKILDSTDKSLYNIIETDKIYPILDIKLELKSSIEDYNKIKTGNYNNNTYMVHYWIHSNFEAKNIIYNFKYNDFLTIHENLGLFFEQMYPINKIILNDKNYIYFHNKK